MWNCKTLKIQRTFKNWSKILSQRDYWKKRLHVFFARKNFFIWMNFGTMFLQLVIIIAYSCPSTLFFSSSFLNKYKFLKVSWFLVTSMLIISNHKQFLFSYIFMFLYDKLQLFLTHHVHFTPFMCGKGLLKF
jgi:hypothetical protein